MTDHSALPATMLDLLRDGVTRPELRKRGGRAVWSALVRTAASAAQCGWSYPEWAGEVCSHRSELGRQAGLKDGKRDLDDLQREERLRAAWDAAEKWLTKVGPAFTREDVEAKCKELRDLVADPGLPLGDVDRAVLAYAVGVGLEKGTDRPTLPLRTTATGAGVSVKAVRLSFVRLAKAGLLVCEVKGRPSGKYAKVVRASAYRLPDPSVLAATVTSTREPEEQIMPTQERSHRRNRATFTVEDASPELLAELAAVLARHERDAKVHTNDRAEAVGNVVPLRKGRTA